MCLIDFRHVIRWWQSKGDGASYENKIRQEALSSEVFASGYLLHFVSFFYQATSPVGTQRRNSFSLQEFQGFG